MTFPCLWGSAPYDTKMQAAANLLIGRQPAARAILAVVGYAQTNEAKIAADLKACADDGAVPVLWLSPNNVDLDAGTIDVPALPDHPSVAKVAALVAAHPAPVVVRILYECANTRAQNGVVLKGPDGQPLYRYGSPVVFREAFAAIAEQMPANAIKAWSYGPNGWPYSPAEWAPSPESWDVGDCSLWGEAHLSLSKVAGKNADKHATFVSGAGKPLIVGESGSATKDAPAGGWTDAKLAAYMKKHLGWCLDHGVRLMAGPFPSDDMGMTDWTQYPSTAKWLAKMLGSPAFVTLPLPAPAQPSPLAAAGLI